MKHLIVIVLSLMLLSGCFNVRQFTESKKPIVSSVESWGIDKCKYKILFDDLFSPDIIWFDVCDKWNVGDELTFVKTNPYSGGW